MKNTSSARNSEKDSKSSMITSSDSKITRKQNKEMEIQKNLNNNISYHFSDSPRDLSMLLKNSQSNKTIEATPVKLSKKKSGVNKKIYLFIDIKFLFFFPFL